MWYKVRRAAVWMVFLMTVVSCAAAQAQYDEEWTRTAGTNEAVGDTAVDGGTFVMEILRLTNMEREKAGKKPLALAIDLSEAATLRAEETLQVYSHTRPNGQAFYTVMKKGSYKTAGENLQAGTATPEAAVRAWMNSPAHRANILNEAFTELGVGYIYEENSRYRHYWAQLFRG